MIYLTQLIYIKEGKESVFLQFEEMAIPIISKYNGRLTHRFRPNNTTTIFTQGKQPYEVHLVEFDQQSDFEAFKKDPERKRFLHLKEDSIESSILIQGERIG